MKRRGFLKAVGMLAALPFMVPLVALCKPEQDGAIDWSVNPISVAAGHVKTPNVYWETVYVKNHLGTEWATESEIKAEMAKSEVNS